MKVSRKLKRLFNAYNIAILICVILILGSLYIILMPNKKYDKNGIEIIQTGIEQSEEISEENAKKAAVKQFEKLGEKTKVEDLKSVKIRRGEIEYYYISSAKNTLEISVIGGKIERINSVLVQE